MPRDIRQLVQTRRHHAPWPPRTAHAVIAAGLGVACGTSTRQEPLSSDSTSPSSEAAADSSQTSTHVLTTSATTTGATTSGTVSTVDSDVRSSPTTTSANEEPVSSSATASSGHTSSGDLETISETTTLSDTFDAPHSSEPTSTTADTESTQENPNTSIDWPLINGVQWADTDGNPIQAHGGGVIQVDGDYYWFGENRNPDGTFYAVSAYRSRDLVRWEHVHDVLTMDSDPDLKPANIERPKVVYNTTTKKFVMWMHWENGKDYGEARAAVASSDSVDGDYTYGGSFRPMRDSGVTDHDKPGYMSRDCTLFVDDDGKGYFLSASNENYDLHLYSLSDDYLSIVDRVALLFDGGHREAPALFKRGNTYFLLTSGATGWDPNQAQFATSSSLTGGWSNLRNVGDSTTYHSQSTFVLPVAGSEGTQFLYMGDRWAGAWDGRVNDSTYVWQPISFPSDTEMSMTWTNNLRFDTERGMVSGTVDSFTFSNKHSGMRLAVSGPADENGSDLVQNPESSATAAAWHFSYDNAGDFRVGNDDGDKVIDVPDESTEAGTHLHVWDDNGGEHQSWKLVDLGLGYVKIVNKKSGLFLGVAAASTEAGAPIEQQSAGGDEQVWKVGLAP